MQASKKAKKEKDTVFAITAVQFLFCTVILLTLFFTYKMNENDFNYLKNKYESLMCEKIEALEIFGNFKGIKEYMQERNAKGDYKSSYKISFSPYVTTFKASLPVEGRISSPFGKREDPFSGKPSVHSGMDIACSAGTAIKNVENGVVNKVGEDDIAGKYISVSHSDNLETFYCHCSEIIASKGAAIRKGETIALVGSTGLSTGPHLHFEVRIGRSKYNPQWLIKAM